jgi:hypothetical protein
MIALGTSVTSSPSNYLTSAGSYPVLCPYWDDIYMGGGSNGSCIRPAINYVTNGTAPNRQLVIEWKDQNAVQSYGTNTSLTFQLRLYETSNKVEFYYGRMNSCGQCGGGCYNTSATIGVAASPSSFMAVTPNGASTSMSMSSTNDYYSLYPTPIADGTVYTFVPCSMNLTGRTGPNDGGTTAMGNGDTFFSNFILQTGQQALYKPFSIQVSDPSCNSTYTLSITGPNAADYYFGTPGTQTQVVAITGSRIDTVGITFKPLGTGIRNAVLTLTSSGGFVRTYNLAARAPLVNYTGIIPQGGTTMMSSGDTLLMGQLVNRFGSQGFTPFSLTNVSPTSQPITYTITDPTNQYTITPGTSLGAGATTTPTITFNPTRFGPQPARLVVSAGGETRTFTLYAISKATGGDLKVVGGVVIDTTTTLFTNVSGCLGEQGTTIAISMVNTGYNDFIIRGAEFYESDTTYGQGRPRYPYRRDSQGRLIPMSDYLLTTTPPVLPLGRTSPVSFPIALAQGQTQTIYLTFVGSRTGKRFAKAFIRTNDQSRAGYDTNGVVTEGIYSFEVFARGVGSILSDNMTGGLPKAVSFPETKIGETSDAFLQLYNPGICPLRVSLPRMNLTAGDVDEFSIVSLPTNGIDAATGDLVLAPGSHDSVHVRFRPQQLGSRRAGMRLMTNDSTVMIPGITERGVYYVDLYGMGKADLYAESVDFGVALIGGTGADLTHKMVRVNNTLSKPVTITKITIDGVDAGEFTEDGGARWPSLPAVVAPGQELDLNIVFGPVAGGTAGGRSANAKIALSNGDTIVARLTGIAGTRTIAVNPSTLNFTVSPGKVNRKTVTVTNSGTMPLTLQPATLSPGSFDYSIGALPRLILAPGQTEFIEISYAPQTSGSSTSSLSIPSNSTTGTAQVTLNGVSKTKRIDVDPSQMTLRGGDENLGAGRNTEMDGNQAVSGVTGEEISYGMMLGQSIPNPARDGVSISYYLSTACDVNLELYDGAGRLVKVLDAGQRGVGEQHVTVDVRQIAAGVYHYRLTSCGHTISRTMTIAH